MRSFKKNLQFILSLSILITVLGYFFINSFYIVPQIKKEMGRLFEVNTLQMKNYIENNSVKINNLLEQLSQRRFVTRFIVDNSELNKSLLESDLNESKLYNLEAEYFLMTYDLEVIYSSNNKVMVLPKQYNDVLNNIVESNKSKKIQFVLGINDLPHVYHIVPIFYMGHIEGFFVAKIKSEVYFSDIIKNSLDNIGIVFSHNNKTIYSKGEQSDYRYSFKSKSLDNVIVEMYAPESIINGPVTRMQILVTIFSVFLLFTISMYSTFVLAPKFLKPLNDFENDIRISMNNTKRLKTESELIEIEKLRETFNSLMSDLKERERESMLKAHKAGMAENAVSVLHNIGNLLTPILIQLETTLSHKDIATGIISLKKVRSILKENFDNGQLEIFLKEDPKGIKTFDFFEMILDELSRRLSEQKEAVQFIQKNIILSSEIISTQQNFSSNDYSSSTHNHVYELVNDTIISLGSLIEKNQIHITVDIDSDDVIKVNRYGIYQVLMNLLKNSVESIVEQRKKDSITQSTIKVWTEKVNSQIFLYIQDNGLGIEKEMQEKLFDFAFSTKNRSSGFGLHNCANFIKKDNGDISIQSEGVGKGALVVISYPDASLVKENC